MKVHQVKVLGKKKEYMCLNELGDSRGCQVCFLYGPNLVESKLRPPKNIQSKCIACDELLVSFFDLPSEQKIALEGKHELDYLVENLTYCPKCRTVYSYFH